MGEYAEMMLEGTLCETCGEFMGEGCGYTRRCAGCCRESRERGGSVAPKVACPICRKLVKAAGLEAHTKDVHARRLAMTEKKDYQP